MKVDYLTINFTTSMISSRTKHEPFDSFGSHAQLFILFMVWVFPYLFNVMSLPSLFCLYSKISKLIQDQNIRRTLPTRPDKNLELSAKLFLYLICILFIIFILKFKKWNKIIKMKMIIIIWYYIFFLICFFKSKNSSFLYIGRRFGIR